ncbi:MAG TPA: O-antigen ligase family protein [Chitinophaga sp.]
MKYAAFILGFFFNSWYMLEVFQLPVAGVSFIYLVIAGVLLILTKPETVKVHGRFILFISLFLLFFLISFPFFNKSAYSYYKFMMIFAKVPALTMIPFFLGKNFRSFFWGYVVALMMLVLLLTLTWSRVATEATTVNSRIGVGVLNPIWISRLIFEMILVSAMILKIGKKKLMLVIAGCLPIIYMSGSKGPIVACLIAWFLHSFRFNRSKWKVIVLGIFLLVTGYVTYLTVGLDENSYFVQRFLRIVPDESSDDIKEESRSVVWPKTIGKLADGSTASLLLGHGIGSFPEFYYGYHTDDRVYPHNFLLELIVEEGLLFTLFVTFCFFYFYRKAKGNFKYLFIFYFINSMFSGDIILNEQVFLYLSFMAMSKIYFNESTVSNFGELPGPGYHPVAGYKPV